MALQGIGFQEDEATVYLAALELGPSSVWDIAKKSGLKRPTCYLILDDLVSKGYASQSHDGRRTLYSVISPTQLLTRMRQRQERLERHLAELEAIGSTSPQKPSVRLFEGVAGVEQAYRLTFDLPEGDEILTYGTASVIDLLPHFIPDYIQRRAKRDIRMRAILPDTPANRAVAARDNKELRETRLLPAEHFDPHLEVNQFGTTITYIAHSEREPFATVIESPTIARLEKQRFELIWHQAISSSSNQ